MSDLAPDVVRLSGWEWLPGMRVFHIGCPMRILSVQEDDFLSEDFFVLRALNERNSEFCEFIAQNETFPDLTDPATGGCLLELLGDEAYYIEREDGRWFAFLDDEHEDFQHLGEACARLALHRGSF